MHTYNNLKLIFYNVSVVNISPASCYRIKDLLLLFIFNKHEL